MSDISAIPAGGVMEAFNKIQVYTEHPTVKIQTEQENKIASLVNSDGFKALQEYIDKQISFLYDDVAVGAKDTPETVGFRYLVSSSTIGYLKSIRDLPKRYAEMLKEPAENE